VEKSGHLTVNVYAEGKRKAMQHPSAVLEMILNDASVGTGDASLRLFLWTN